MGNLFEIFIYVIIGILIIGFIFRSKGRKVNAAKKKPNYYGLGKFNYFIFKFLCSRFRL